MPFVFDLNVYNNKLIASGRFTTAGTTPANVIAAWDGSTWSNLGGGFKKGDNAYVSLTFNNELYLGGYFDSIGSIKVKNIAKWNGTSWSPLSTGADDIVWDLCVYNNELYASGNFSVIGGVVANGIARWDGTNWHALANGFAGSAFGTRDLCVYNNSLCVVGSMNITGCTNCQYIACWNGSSWSGVGTSGLPLMNQALIVWNGKLLIGSNNELNPPYADTEVRQWDGTNLTMFSKQPSAFVQKFYIFNNELYCSGGWSPSCVSKWSVSTSSWIPVGTGPNQQTFGLVEYNGELYCSGNFNTAEGSNLNYIGRLTNVSGINELTKNTEILISPNPTNDHFKINFADGQIILKKVEIINILGDKVLEINEPTSNSDIDISSIIKGVYLVRVYTDKNSFTKKIIKE